MHRWIARLLVLAMLVPAFGPLAMARVSPPMGPHCQRQPRTPVMQCHHGMSMAPPEAPSSGASIGAVAQCCLNHDCCCRVGTHQWARTPSLPLGHLVLPIQQTQLVSDQQSVPVALLEGDSARAPPRV